MGGGHSHWLTDLKAKKSFTKTYKDHHVVKHPSVTSVTCCCAMCNHRAGCGCVTDYFIRNTRINHFLVFTQSGKNSQVYASRMRERGKYNAQVIHQWKCSFHPSMVCSCGNCDDDDNLQPFSHPTQCLFLSIETRSLASRGWLRGGRSSLPRRSRRCFLPLVHYWHFFWCGGVECVVSITFRGLVDGLSPRTSSIRS